MKLKVYTASKLSAAPKWRNLKDGWPEVEFVARWPFLYVDEKGEAGWPEDSAAFGSVFWTYDHEDVVKADVVLVWGVDEDPSPLRGLHEDPSPLRGALVEAGMAIALGKPVIVIGNCKAYGTWQYHPQVHRVDSFEDARKLLRLIACKY